MQKERDVVVPQSRPSDRLDIELFAGGGGMAVGLHKAGFSPGIFIESDDACCATLRLNCRASNSSIAGKVIEENAEKINWESYKEDVRLLAAGAPCQPFSLGGKHYAEADKRNLFPEVCRAIREIKPVAVLIENVRGILRPSSFPYFQYVLRQIQFPDVALQKKEEWFQHDHRLKRIEKNTQPLYQVDWRLLNAADYGVPQNRLRVFVVATRKDHPRYTFPEPTHSRAALLRYLAKKDYWQNYNIPQPDEYKMNVCLDLLEVERLPWVTVRDSLQGLPEPTSSEKDAIINHWMIPGAKSYSGHSGSHWDWIAKTIKAGAHGVPGGENTIREPDGSVRYFTLRESARIQTFPDDHIFSGARTRVTRQIGNAVPCKLAEAVAAPLFRIITS